MHVDTGHIYERNPHSEKWEKDESIAEMFRGLVDGDKEPLDDLTDEQMQELVDAGEMVTGSKEDLIKKSNKIRDNIRRRQKIDRLSKGTKNQKKKARQMQKASRKKNRRR